MNVKAINEQTANEEDFNTFEATMELDPLQDYELEALDFDGNVVMSIKLPRTVMRFKCKKTTK